MAIRILSPTDAQRQSSAFVDCFEQEFMAEINYLEETSRGNIVARTDASLAMVFNVACALVSLAPIPGGVLALMAVPHAVNAAIKIGTLAIENEWSQKAIAIAAEYLTGDVKDQISTLQGGAGEKFSLGDDMPIDRTALSVLSRWLGVLLARRYEHVLTERLSTQPDQAIMGLARVAARRCLAYFAENPLPAAASSSLQARTQHLLDGVLVGAAVPWYHRPLQLLKSGERLHGRDEASHLRFTAEKLFINGLWVNDCVTGEVRCLEHKNTEWVDASPGLLRTSANPLAGLPKYGYIAGLATLPDLELKPLSVAPADLIGWLNRRCQQPVTIHDVRAYLSSSIVQQARTESRVSSQSFAQFLHQKSPSSFPSEAQAVLCCDLSELELRSGNFSGVDFSGCSFTGDVSYVSFENARLFGCTGRALHSVPGSTVCFARAEMGFSVFSEGRFEGSVNFTQANLTCVDLSNSSFGEVEHVGATWHKAVLTNVNYDAIRRSQKEQLAAVETEQARQRAQLDSVSAAIRAL